jgi:hypothetical protein
MEVPADQAVAAVAVAVAAAKRVPLSMMVVVTAAVVAAPGAAAVDSEGEALPAEDHSAFSWSIPRELKFTITW